MAIGVQTDMATPALARFGSDEVRREFLAPAIAGDAVACIGVSEPGAGSDVASIKTTARSDGDDYVINGGKMWITNGLQADWMCLLANTSDGPVHRNKSLICVPMKTKGVAGRAKTRQDGDALVRHRADLLRRRAGAEAQPHRRGRQGLHLPDGAVPGGAAVGRRPASRRMNTSSPTPSNTPATARRSARASSTTRIVHFKLAEMQTEVELLRALIYRAAEALVAGEDVTRLATMAKLKAGRLGRELTDACLQYWGGMGFMNETPVSRAYRDSRLTSIGGGADEVMLTVLCKMMGTLPGEKQLPS